MNNWKGLDINNLPHDILVGAYEWQFLDHDDIAQGWIKSFADSYSIIEQLGKDCGISFRYRKCEPKAPSHEEIMTKWWSDDGVTWGKVTLYNHEIKMYNIKGIGLGWQPASYFPNMKSSDLPPETP